MIRKAFIMRLDPGQLDEYRRRHNPIWPELEATLKAHGARNYSIYFEASSSSLFAYVELEDEARWQAVASTDVCRRWWAAMKDIMASNPDNSPISIELEEVFHLD